MFKCFKGKCSPSRDLSRLTYAERIGGYENKPNPSKKSNNTKSTNLSLNELRAIAEFLSPRHRRALSKATNIYTHSTLPIGLRVTKVGAPPIQVIRPPAFNRSRAVSATPKILTSRDYIDRFAPQAYKNNNWQYYFSWPILKLVVFLNTPKGEPFIFNKEGKRVNLQQKLFTTPGGGIPANWRQKLRLRRKNFHKWEEYQKRITASHRFRRRRNINFNRVYADIGNKVARYARGDRHALDGVTFAQLVIWANAYNSPMAANGSPYVQNRATRLWRRVSQNVPLTRSNILNNIRLEYSSNPAIFN